MDSLMFKILIADDHRIVAESLVRLIEQLPVEGKCIGQVVGTAYTLSDALQQCIEHQPDILLLDMAMPDGNGIDFLPQLQEHCPQLKVAILTYYSEPSIVRLALNNGAKGYFLKAGDPQELVLGLKRMGEGEIYICQEARESLEQKNKAGQLTAREREILRLLVEGRSIKEIASELYLSFETVHSYTKAIRQKMGVNNMASLVREALLQHLV